MTRQCCVCGPAGQTMEMTEPETHHHPTLRDDPEYQDGILTETLSGQATDPNPEDEAVGNCKSAMHYGLEDSPAWSITLCLGLQHYVTMLSGMVSLPMILGPAFCIQNDEVAKTLLLNTMLLVSGIATLLQAGVGTRLPIVQGASFSVIAPIFAMMSLEQWKCPDYTAFRQSVFINGTNVTSPYETPEHAEMWKSRLREIQGAIMVSSLVQVFLGFSGLMGSLLYYIGPLSIAPTLSLIGLVFFKEVGDFCATHWGISMLSLALMIIFSQYLSRGIPLCKYKRSTGCHLVKYPLFEMFPVITTIAFAWSFCAILTVCGIFPEDPMESAYVARADAKLKAISDSEWFRLPYPCQWGLPTVSAYGVCGMLAGIMAGIIESIGDYYACAKLLGESTPPVHSINRGIFIEGIGCVLSGLWGCGAGTTSYTENISIIAVTKVGSRRVIYVAAVFMIVLSTLGKFGAFFVSIPDPIIGGISVILFGVVGSIGMSSLQYVDMSSPRNLFVVGISFFFGILLPFWLQNHPGAINTGVEQLDQIINVLLGTGMFVGGVLGFFFDNTLPGTEEERGIGHWRANLRRRDTTAQCYDLPFCMGWIRSQKWTRHVPISPSYSQTSMSDYLNRCKRKHKSTPSSDA